MNLDEFHSPLVSSTFPARGGLAERLLSDRVTTDPDRAVLAVRGPAGWADISVAELAERVELVAAGLATNGVRPGDRVAVLGVTSDDWVAAGFAVWRIGAVLVPVYPTSSNHQIEAVVLNSQARACLADTEDQLKMLCAAGIGSQRGWLLSKPPRPARMSGATRESEVSLSQPAAIVYTSGTTGQPRGCLLTHQNLLSAAANAGQILAEVFVADEGEPADQLLFLPLSHVFGLVSLIGGLLAGVRTGLVANANDLLTEASVFRPTFLISVPYALEKIRKGARQAAVAAGAEALFERAEAAAIEEGHARRRAGDGPLAVGPSPFFDQVRAALGGRLRFVVCGGASLDATTADFFAGIGVQVLGAYGLTESSTSATMSSPVSNRAGAVGRPIPGTGIRISPDGELLVCGPQVTAGYWVSANGPELVDGPDRDGWMPTGDLGSIDEDGYLTITGRRKELIITSGGKNVSPTPLEDRMRLHPMVSNCVVIGDGRAYVAALVTLDPPIVRSWAGWDGVVPDPAQWPDHPRILEQVQQAVDAANELVSRAESIRRFRVLPGQFTPSNGQLTASLKLRRDVIGQAWAEEVAGLYPV